MKTYEGMDLLVHVLLMPTLALCIQPLYYEERAPPPRGWMGPRARLDVVAPAGYRTPLL